MLAVTVLSPLLGLGAASAQQVLDTWELVEGSLAFDVETIMSPGEEGEEVDAEPSVRLELLEGHRYKLSIVTTAAEGHFLHPAPIVGEPDSANSWAISGFGFYGTRSDTVRFAASSMRLEADGEDLAEIIARTGDRRFLREYEFALALVNSLLLDLFNDLYAYEADGRLVFLLREGSRFLADPAERTVWELRRTGTPPRFSSTAVEATVLGSAVAGLTVEFARAVSGRRTHYAWSEVTDADGQVALTLTTVDPHGASGFYKVRVLRGSRVVGGWHSIPLNRGRRQVLELTLGGSARVVSSQRLEAAKPVSSQEASEATNLAPNHPNPFNSSTQLVYRMGVAGPVRLEIYNALGQPVRVLVDKDFQDAGMYQVEWDARDQRGGAVASGVYLSLLHYSGQAQTRRLLYLR